MVEMLGPCRFSHFNDDGNPVGKDNPAAWVQLSAVSADQTRTTMSLFPLLLPKRTIKEFAVELGKEKLYALGGRRRLEILTTSFRSQEGARVTFVVLNEGQHWLRSNGGHDLYDVITRNRTKAKGGAARALQITNAFQPGEDSIAERTRTAYDKTVDINPVTGKPYAAFAGLLYDSLEAPANAPLDPAVAPFILERIRGDSVWLDIESIVNFIVDTRNPPSLSRRFFYNQITADEETLIPPALWDPLKSDKVLATGDEIVLGFDGSRTRDATALVAIRVADQHIVPLGIWERDKKAAKWEVPREEVSGAVDNAFAEYHVVAFFSDVHPWESYVDVWSNKYREVLLVKAAGDHAIGYNMSGHQQDITEANMRFVAAIADKTFTHNGDPVLRRHVMNCRRMFNKWGMTFTKEGRENDQFNDGYAAMLLAFIALSKYLESGKRPKKPLSGRVWQFP